MNNDDVERYAKDPRMLVELCRAVFDRIECTDRQIIQEKKLQLQEIARAIENLENVGVAIPDTLRAEKTRLAAELQCQKQNEQILFIFADELKSLFSTINEKLQKINNISQKYKTRRTVSNPLRIEFETLKEYFISALRSLGGSAKSSDVYSVMESELNDNFLPGDMEKNKDGQYSWQYRVRNIRRGMLREGTLRSDSPNGIWEFSEDVK